MVIRSKQSYENLKLLISEDDAGSIFSNKISLQDFCDGTKDTEVNMIKLNGGNRKDIDKLKKCDRLN